MAPRRRAAKAPTDTQPADTPLATAPPAPAPSEDTAAPSDAPVLPGEPGDAAPPPLPASYTVERHRDGWVCHRYAPGVPVSSHVSVNRDRAEEIGREHLRRHATVE